MIVHKLKPKKASIDGKTFESPYILCRPIDHVDLYPTYSGPELRGFGENSSEPDMQHKHWGRTNCRECFAMDESGASRYHLQMDKRTAFLADAAEHDAFMEELKAL